METAIISLKNEKVKSLEKLQKPRVRTAKNLIIVEGEREIQLALKAGLKISDFFYCPTLIKNQKALSIIKAQTENINTVTAEIFKKIAYKENPDGFLTTFSPRYLNLSDLKLKKSPLIIVLEAVEKPGNLGGILRTAYAAGIDAVIVNDPQTDIYNPNVIRASMGHIFTVPTIVASISETTKFLKSKKITSYGTTIKGGEKYTKANFKKSTALIMGTENSGLSQNWLKNINKKITIPMKAEIDSLNVSVSTAIIVYEVLRQRNFIDF